MSRIPKLSNGEGSNQFGLTAVQQVCALDCETCDEAMCEAAVQ